MNKRYLFRDRTKPMKPISSRKFSNAGIQTVAIEFELVR